MTVWGPGRRRSGELLLRARWPWALLLLVALAARLVMWPNGTLDYFLPMRPWVEEVRAAGGLAAIGQPISNYTPPYLYLLALVSYLPASPLVVIKAMALLVDAGLAVAVGALAAALRPGPRAALAAAVATVLLPSVVLDGALLGQFDGLYAAPTASALLFVLRERHAWGWAMLGVALAVKLQAIFVLPLVVVLVVNRRLTLKALPWAVVGWAASMAPAVVAGRPVTDLPGLYTDQVGLFSAMTLNAPNIYQWVRHPPLGVAGALLVSAVVVGGVMLWLARGRVGADDALVVRAAVLLLMLVPFTLPRMHERYTFAADVLAVAYAFVTRHGWALALAASTVSALAYLPFGVGLPIPVAELTGVELALILLIARGLVHQLTARRASEEQLEDVGMT